MITETHRRVKSCRRVVDAVGLLVLIGLVTLALLVAYLPMCLQKGLYEDRMAEGEEFLQSKPEIQARHTRLSEQLEASEALLTGLLARIPDEPQESEFLAQLAQLARESGLATKEFRPGEATQEGKLGQVEIQFSASGNYEQICRFLAGLQNMPRFCRVNSLKVAVEDPLAGAYPVEVGLLVYFTAADNADV